LFIIKIKVFYTQKSSFVVSNGNITVSTAMDDGAEPGVSNDQERKTEDEKRKMKNEYNRAYQKRKREKNKEQDLMLMRKRKEVEGLRNKFAENTREKKKLRQEMIELMEREKKLEEKQYEFDKEKRDLTRKKRRMSFQEEGLVMMIEEKDEKIHEMETKVQEMEKGKRRKDKERRREEFGNQKKMEEKMISLENEEKKIKRKEKEIQVEMNKMEKEKERDKQEKKEKQEKQEEEEREEERRKEQEEREEERRKKQEKKKEEQSEEREKEECLKREEGQLQHSLLVAFVDEKDGTIENLLLCAAILLHYYGLISIGVKSMLAIDQTLTTFPFISQKTFYRWRNHWLQSEGLFSSSRGQWERPWLLNDISLRARFVDHVRTNARGGDGNARLTVASLTGWVNSTLLSDTVRKRDRPFCESTIRIWLHRLDFRCKTVSRSIYIDGHEEPKQVFSTVQLFLLYYLFINSQIKDRNQRFLPAFFEHFHNQRVFTLNKEFLYEVSDKNFVLEMKLVREKYIQEVRNLGTNLHGYMKTLSLENRVLLQDIPPHCVPVFLKEQRFIPLKMKYLKWDPNLLPFLAMNYLVLTEEDVPSGCVRPNFQPEDRITLIVNSDEVIRKCGEYSNYAWQSPETPVPLAKSKGQGCMMSAFSIAEGNGWLELTPLEYARWRWSLVVDSWLVGAPLSERSPLILLSQKADQAISLPTSILPQFCKETGTDWDPNRMDSTVLLTYGKGKDGYFDSLKFKDQFQRALEIGAIKRPSCDIIHLIDHSGCHDAKSKDALDATKMTLSNDCKSQPSMRSTVFGPEQTPQNIGKKGLVTVLLERNISPYQPGTTKLKLKEQLVQLLLEEPDFAASGQICLIDEILSAHNILHGRNDRILWGVKYHPELMFIEQKWAYDRNILQPEVNQRYLNWPKKMLEATRKCPLITLQRFCRKSYDTSVCYAEGTHLIHLKKSLKIKKTHRAGSTQSELYIVNRD
jgi:hypothetical protein